MLKHKAPYAGNKVSGRDGGSPPSTIRARQRPKLQEIKASLSKQSHAESEEVHPSAPVCMVLAAQLAIPLSPAKIKSQRHKRVDG